MVAEIFSRPNFQERMCLRWGSNLGPLASQAVSLLRPVLLVSVDLSDQSMYQLSLLYDFSNAFVIIRYCSIWPIFFKNLLTALKGTHFFCGLHLFRQPYGSVYS